MSHLVFWIGISLDDLIWLSRLALRFLEETGLLMASYPMKYGNEHKLKRQKMNSFQQEQLPEQIVCLEYPTTTKPPKVIFSQVADAEALKKAVL